MSQYASPHPQPVLVGVIGGSGVYKLECLRDACYYDMNTPFGRPSGMVCVAKVNDLLCAFLPRHGPHHTFNPSEVNYRANICAMKQLGVKYLLAINAVGSLDADYQPGDLVVVDQMIDKTYARQATFFEGGVVVHTEFAHPTSRRFGEIAYRALLQCFPGAHARDGGSAGFVVHPRGTLVTMEGPQFSTRAESLLNKQQGGHLIGMTASTEARLAREAELAYCVIAMVTDMDAWSEAPHVDVAAVNKVMQANAAKAQIYPPAILQALHANLFDDSAHQALACGIVTRPEHMSTELKAKLAPLLAAKYPQYAP